HLGADLLEELRLLGNLEAPHGKAVQVVLAAQPTIGPHLRRAGLKAVAQRLAVRARLAPLGREEAGDYLAHHLRLAGGRPEELIDDEALEVLVRATGGIPRLLNQAGSRAFRLAHREGATVIDVEAALGA